MRFYKFLFASCALMLLETGCEDSGKKQQEKNTEKKEDVALDDNKNKENLKETETKSAKNSLETDIKNVENPGEEKISDETTATHSENNIKAAETNSNGKIAAHFKDGSVITQSEVLKRIKLLPEKVQGLPFIQLYNLVLFVMVQEYLAYTSAIKEGFDKNDKLIKEIQSLTDSLLQQYYLDEESKKFITPASIKKQYEDLIKNFKVEDEVGLRHILVKTKEEALHIIDELKKDKSFDELQEKYSIDKKTLENKGFLGFFRKAQLPQNEAQEIIETPVNKFVAVPISVPKTGYSILFISEKRKSAPAPLEKVQEKIISILQKRYALQLIGDFYKTHNVVMFSPGGAILPYRDVDQRLADLKEKQKNKRQQPTADEIKNEQSINKLTDSFVVAKFGNGTEVKFSQISAFIKEKPTMFKGLSPYEVYVYAVEEYLNRIFLKEAIKKQNIDQKQEIKKKIDKAKEALIGRRFLAYSAGKNMTESELRKSYENLISKIDRNEIEIRLRVIPVKSIEDGVKAINEVKAGKSFDTVMANHCIDPRFKENKGDMGYLNKNKLILLSSELYEAADKAPKATLLPKPIEVNGQILVVRIDDKRVKEIPSYQQSKDLIKRRLISERMIKVTLDMIQKNEVEAYGFNGNKIDLSEQALEKTLGNHAI